MTRLKFRPVNPIIFGSLIALLVVSLGCQPKTVLDIDGQNQASSKPEEDPNQEQDTDLPIPPGDTTPDPLPEEVPMPPPVVDLLRVILDLGFITAQNVDQLRSTKSELTKTRSPASQHSSDLASDSLKGEQTFSDRISFNVWKKMNPTVADLSVVRSILKIVPASQMQAVSLYSHRMCEVSRSSLTSTLGSTRVPSDQVIEKINRWVKKYNDTRSKILNNQEGAVVDLAKQWSRWMMCLAYTESLTTADTNTSRQVASRVAPAGYVKPDGVKFYEDPLQPEVSRLNIGLYQFTPDSGGNIRPCLSSWNKAFPDSPISLQATRSEAILFLGSGYQTFNSYCGVDKVHQLFSVQVNTQSPGSTHPSNFVNGKLVAAENRCVSLHFTSGKAYNHFGPFQNSTGKNLEELLDCALD